MLLNYRRVYEKEGKGNSAAGGCPNTPTITRLDCTLILRRAARFIAVDNGERDLFLRISLSPWKESESPSN